MRNKGITTLRIFESFTIILSLTLMVFSSGLIAFSYIWQKEPNLQSHFERIIKNETELTFEEWSQVEWRVLLRNICLAALVLTFSLSQIFTSAVIISNWKRGNLLWGTVQNGILIGLTSIVTLSIVFELYFYRIESTLPIAPIFCGILYMYILYLMSTRIILFYILNRQKDRESLYSTQYEMKET